MSNGVRFAGRHQGIPDVLLRRRRLSSIPPPVAPLKHGRSQPLPQEQPATFIAAHACLKEPIKQEEV